MQEQKIVVNNEQMDKINIHVLVAEDDSFQRLALMDILQLCEYEVTAVENGRLARDELLRDNQHFDIILLDLMMPEMDGLELLKLIKSLEKLKDIPVIMMSAEGEKDYVSACLQNGAVDYLVKPLRIQMVKGISNHVNKQKNQATCNSDKVTYKRIKVLGQGAAGSVELVQRSDNNDFYAMKVIPLHFMTPQERKLAEQEVTLLKVLVAPTIIRYYDSYIQNDSISIVMEYARVGTLYDKIMDFRQRGERIDDKLILYFISQLILAVMFMHSKNILHRDIKTQNMFLTKDTVVKLGDFGIAKALGTNADMTKTMIGTPYFMSPEVCKGEQYGQKADVWAIGCTLYELVMLKRPFSHDNINMLFDIIKNQDPPPLYENVSQDIRMMINAMLNKDPTRRPNAYELAQMPCILQNIEKYQQEEAKDDSFIDSILQGFKKKQTTKQAQQPIEPSKENNNQQAQKQQQPQGQQQQIQTQQKQNSEAQRIEEIVKAIHEKAKFQSIKVSMFQWQHNVIQKKDIEKWFKKHYPSNDDTIAPKTIEEMINLKYLHFIVQQKNDKGEMINYYKFQMDMNGIAANQIKYWQGQANAAPLILQQLIDLANSVLKEVIDTQQPDQIDLTKLVSSLKFTKFQEMTCELQSVELEEMDKHEIKVFFINLLQIMYFHYYLLSKLKLKNSSLSQEQGQGIIYKIFSYIPIIGPKKIKEIFYYQIGKHNFTIDDIKHGILRGNRKPNFKTDFICFNKKDPRLEFIVQEVDYCVLLLFREENVVPKQLMYFQVQNLMQELDKISKNFLNLYVCYDPVDNNLTLHKILKLYQTDFTKGIQDQINWILKYNKNIGNAEEIIQGIQEGSINVQYEEKFE